MVQQTIWLHSDAPPKPAYGAACNGCGTCCAVEPCPVGMLLSLRMRGRCRLLRYDTANSRYRCGLMPDASAARDTRRAFADGQRGLRQRLVARWIGAGLGCDSSAEAIAARR